MFWGENKIRNFSTRVLQKLHVPLIVKCQQKMSKTLPLLITCKEQGQGLIVHDIFDEYKIQLKVNQNIKLLFFHPTPIPTPPKLFDNLLPILTVIPKKGFRYHQSQSDKVMEE